MIAARGVLSRPSLAKISSRSVVAAAPPGPQLTLSRLTSHASKPRYFSSHDSTGRYNGISGKITGEESQSLVVDLAPGETIRAGDNSVLRQPINRVTVVSNQTLISIMGPSVKDLSNTMAEDVKLTLGTAYDDHKITKVCVDDKDELICEMRGFLCASKSIVIEKVRSGSYFSHVVLGKNKLWILHKLSGKGEVFLRGKNLERVSIGQNEALEVPAEHVVAFSRGMEYRFDDVKVHNSLNADFSNKMIMTTLTGPGTLWKQSGSVWVQPMTWSWSEVAALVPSGIFGCMVGWLVGGLVPVPLV